MYQKNLFSENLKITKMFTISGGPVTTGKSIHLSFGSTD